MGAAQDFILAHEITLNPTIVCIDPTIAALALAVIADFDQPTQVDRTTYMPAAGLVSLVPE